MVLLFAKQNQEIKFQSGFDYAARKQALRN
jgi:hypothetical protein